MSSNDLADDKQDLIPFDSVPSEEAQHDLLGTVESPKKIITYEKQQKVEDIVEEIIDPLMQMKENNNILPLLSVIDRISMDTLIDGKPLLSVLCQKCIPFQSYLSYSQVNFTLDSNFRSALQYAIEVDDVRAAAWCLNSGIKNTRDAFGSTAILDAIKFNRRRIFMLCLHHKFYDSEAPHLCAVYNRVWELKLLHSLKNDIIDCKDSEGYTPFDRAITNYSFEAIEYLGTIQKRQVDIRTCKLRTDSEGIVRLLKKVNRSKKLISSVLISVLGLSCNILFIYVMCSRVSFHTSQLDFINILLFCLEIIFLPMILVPLIKPELEDINSPDPNVLINLLKAPEYPPLEEICPTCLAFSNPLYDHCKSCNTCVKKLHYHSYVCFNRDNEIFLFVFELLWLYLVFFLERSIVDYAIYSSLETYRLSGNPIFLFMNIMDILIRAKRWKDVVWFLYIKISLLYYCGVMIQWLIMMGLRRTYQQTRHTERYLHLYELVRDSEGNQKNKEKKIMSKGLLPGMLQIAINVLTYFIS